MIGCAPSGATHRTEIRLVVVSAPPGMPDLRSLYNPNCRIYASTRSPRRSPGSSTRPASRSPRGQVGQAPSHREHDRLQLGPTPEGRHRPRHHHRTSSGPTPRSSATSEVVMPVADRRKTRRSIGMGLRERCSCIQAPDDTRPAVEATLGPSERDLELGVRKERPRATAWRSGPSTDRPAARRPPRLHRLRPGSSRLRAPGPTGVPAPDRGSAGPAQ